MEREAQPAQEPVAWRFKDLKDGHWVYTTHIVDLKYWRLKNEVFEPLYTAPPQRPWVEPTAGEWFKCWLDLDAADKTEAEFDFADFLIIAQAVLAKLKEARAEAERELERNFCPRCGKRTADLTVIHTCTPPQEKNGA
jgi:hypothetical protein